LIESKGRMLASARPGAGGKEGREKKKKEKKPPPPRLFARYKQNREERGRKGRICGLLDGSRGKGGKKEKEGGGGRLT